MSSLVPEDLESVLDELGMDVGRSTGLEVWATCPNPEHDDSRPTNYSVNTESGNGFCFACGFRHEGLTSLVAQLTGLNGWDASRWLRERGATVSARLERIQERREGSSPTFDVNDYSIESQFAVFTDPPSSALKERDLSRDAAVEYGVRWNAEHETFVLPVHDARGNLVGWQERRKPKPLNHPRGLKKKLTLFGIEIFRGKTAILVESPLDAVRLWSVGLDGGLSSFGARVSAAQMRLIISKAKRLILALDNDDAGISMTDELVARYAHRLPIHRFYYGDAEGKDPGDMTSSEILRGIRQAEFALQVRPARRVHRVYSGADR